MKHLFQAAIVAAGLLVAGPAAAEEHETPTAVVGHGGGEEAEAAGHGEEHGGHGHDISQIKWLPDITGKDERKYPAFAWMVINFLVLVGLFYFAGRKTVARFLKERRDRLMASIDEASRLRKEAEERHGLYSDKLARMKEEEQSIRDDLLSAAVREKERLVADAGARAEKMRTEARLLTEREQADIQMRLRQETVNRAVEIAREILVAKVGPGEHRRLVDDYMKLLDAQVKS